MESLLYHHKAWSLAELWYVRFDIREACRRLAEFLSVPFDHRKVCFDHRKPCGRIAEL